MKLDIPYYKQLTDYECGPTCCRMVLKHYYPELNITREDVQSFCKTTKCGTYFTDALKVLNSFGLSTTRVRSHKAIQRTLDRGNPLFAWCFNHIVVLIGYDKKKEVYYFNDPWYGKNYYLPIDWVFKLDFSAYEVSE